jgi:hypothetical protein
LFKFRPPFMRFGVKVESMYQEVFCRQWNWLQPNGYLKDMACRRSSRTST